MKKRIVCLITICVAGAYADDDQQKISNFLKSVPSTIEKAGQGIAESFGASPGSQYQISYGFFNDTPQSIYAAKHPIVNVQGANIVKDIDLDMLIGPYKNSGTTFYNMQLRFGVVADYDPSMNNSKSKYKEKIDKATALSKSNEVTQFMHSNVALGDPSQPGYHDPYIVHAYTRQDKMGFEYLSQIITTSYFVGVFYNNTDNPVKLDFLKDDHRYKVTLDPHSCNNLSSSDQPYSIRPKPSDSRSFVFSGAVSASLSIPSLGFVGAPYTYEVYKNNVNIQGLNIGHFDQIPLDAQGKQAPTRFRDINPVPCSLWPKTNAQIAQSQDATKPSITEPYSYWVLYNTNDQSIIKKLELGKSNDMFLMRPQLAEKEAWLYVFLPLTQDDQKCRDFLKRVAANKITFTKESLTLKSNQSYLEVNTQGLVDDSASDGTGVKAYLMLADVFLPMGLGSMKLFYSLEPSTIGIDQLVNTIFPYIDNSLFTGDSSTSVEQRIVDELTAQVPQWITEYTNDKTNQGLTSYLQAKGVSRLFKSAQDKQFNETGLQVVAQLTTGDVSLAHYPVLRYAGSCDFAAPAGYDQIDHVAL